MWFGLIILTISVFGISFLLTNSFLFETPRSLVSKIAEKTTNIPVIRTVTLYLEYLVHCIVCTSVWVSILLFLLYQHSIVLSNTLPNMLNYGDLPLLIGWSAGTNWLLAKLTGIAD